MSWYGYIIGAVVILLFAVILYKLCGVDKVKRWLEWAVYQTEAALGSGTGQLKLRTVYDMMLAKFPVFSKFLPWWLFKLLVDKALELMREQLSNNATIASLVIGSKGE